LALARLGPHLGDLHVEHALHRLPDLDLVGAGRDLERDGVGLFLLEHALLGHERPEQDRARVSHLRLSSSVASAPRSIPRRSQRTTGYADGCTGVSTSSHGMFRAAWARAGERSPTTSSVQPPPTPSLPRAAASALVFGCASVSRSTAVTAPAAIFAA